jgi:hypothetical protein
MLHCSSQSALTPMRIYPLLLGCVGGDPLEDLLQLAAVEGPEGGGGEY